MSKPNFTRRLLAAKNKLRVSENIRKQTTHYSLPDLGLVAKSCAAAIDVIIDLEARVKSLEAREKERETRTQRQRNSDLAGYPGYD